MSRPRLGRGKVESANSSTSGSESWRVWNACPQAVPPVGLRGCLLPEAPACGGFAGPEPTLVVFSSLQSVDCGVAVQASCFRLVGRLAWSVPHQLCWLSAQLRQDSGWPLPFSSPQSLPRPTASSPVWPCWEGQWSADAVLSELFFFRFALENAGGREPSWLSKHIDSHPEQTLLSLTDCEAE